MANIQKATIKILRLIGIMMTKMNLVEKDRLLFGQKGEKTL